ncbi:DUF3540 domain-containing protein [Oceanospirillum sp.]|uniref:DUF3540 domain-containing protein n=1 Tax=Oceanospirillum sp. TaxID=2021254 RepID=UPI003A93CB77
MSIYSENRSAEHKDSHAAAHPVLLHGNKLMTADVISVSSDNAAGLMLKAPIGVIKAQIAFSCHTQPEEGDTVLLADSDTGYFVTDILTRLNPSPAKQSFPQGVELKSSKKISLESHQEIAINSTGKTSLTAADFSLAALRGRVRILDLVALISEFNGRFTKLSWISDWAEQKAGTFRQRFKRSDRKVEEQDVQKAGSLIQQVDKTASLRAEHTIIKARKDVQVDGKRIHMG